MPRKYSLYGASLRASMVPELGPGDDDLQRDLSSRYRLLRRIGAGGTAIVYQAADDRHQRSVAIKVLIPDLAEAAFIARFLREIRIVARLTHPHILPLLDSGEAAGLPYYVMPFVDGESLQERLNPDAPLPPGEAVRLACEIADALDYAHAAGIIHRDVKPGNVLLAGKHALVVDFGAGRLMRPRQDDPLRTQLGMIIGTPLYMSPEQVAADEDLDGRSDIYSLGCVLYEMLTGVPPFVGRTTPETLAIRLAQDPAPLREREPSIPPALEVVVLRALSREPDGRPLTAGALALALMDAMRASEAPSATSGARSRDPASTSPRTSSESAPAQSIAVMPFVSLGDDVGHWFADGITEEVTTTLARIRHLHVSARITADALRGASGDSRALARRLGVASLLEGSVRQSGSQVRIAVRLVDVDDGFQIWSKQYAREVGDVLAIQEEIARAIAAALELRLLGQESAPLATASTRSAEAFELYLRGRHAWNKRTEEQLARSVALLEHALALDPQFAAAHAGLADSLVALGLYGARAPREVFPAARAAAHRALEIDPTLADAHASLGCTLALHDWDWRSAGREFERAIALEPRASTAHHWYAMHVLVPLGRVDEAVGRARHAASLDPLSPAIAAGVGVVLYAARRYAESRQHLERVLDAEPHFAIAHYFLGHALVQLGEGRRAIAAFHRAIALSGGSVETTAALAHAYACVGDRDSATSLLAELGTAAERRYVSPYLFATVHAALDERFTALDWIERAHRERAAELPWVGVRPVFDRLRSEPRFRAVLGSMGISELQRSAAGG